MGKIGPKFSYLLTVMVEGADPIQLPRVIERGVWINDSREFEFPPVRHWQPVGGGVHTRVKWCEHHFALL